MHTSKTLCCSNTTGMGTESALSQARTAGLLRPPGARSVPLAGSSRGAHGSKPSCQTPGDWDPSSFAQNIIIAQMRGAQ